MIDSIRIKNFKSIVDLSLDLGQFNLIIGANGCGKTNILEAITFASAAAQNKLDTESLLNRDIRISDSQFMFNAFDDIDQDSFISVDITSKTKLNTNVLIGYAENLKKWVNVASVADKLKIKNALELLEKQTKESIELLHDETLDFFKLDKTHPEIFNSLKGILIDKPELSSFITYRPSEFHLRKIFEAGLFPFGIKGEGLLRYLKDVGSEQIELFAEINKGLHLLDWFDNVFIPDDLLSNEYALSIGDKYLKESMHTFDQRSANEGFLYLLFYLTLFNSKDTPPFFAIDNIETSFNPKLCTKLTEYLVDVSLKNNKQVILTTHSPYVLDGLDLSKDNIRLFVARRDIDGHTRIERIKYRADRTMLLSELWMSGLIGGLPDNF